MGHSPISLNIENEMTLVKFRISSYFAQITSIVSCFRKYHSKALKRFSFFRNREKFEIAILAANHRQKWPNIVHFLFARSGQHDDIYQFTLDSGYCMSSVAVSRALI